MAKNTGNESRLGSVKNRTQTYNEKTGKYIKRDTETGQFLSNKDTPYKGIRRDDNAKKQEIKDKIKKQLKK